MLSTDLVVAVEGPDRYEDVQDHLAHLQLPVAHRERGAVDDHDDEDDEAQAGHGPDGDALQLGQDAIS